MYLIKFNSNNNNNNNSNNNKNINNNYIIPKTTTEKRTEAIHTSVTNTTAIKYQEDITTTKPIAAVKPIQKQQQQFDEERYRHRQTTMFPELPRYRVWF